MVFVVQGNKLVRREVEFGESNFNYVEITKGLKKGEKIAISDMSDYEKNERLTVNSKQ
jgi:HlyD family secretion protein